RGFRRGRLRRLGLRRRRLGGRWLRRRRFRGGAFRSGSLRRGWLGDVRGGLLGRGGFPARGLRFGFAGGDRALGGFGRGGVGGLGGFGRAACFGAGSAARGLGSSLGLWLARAARLGGGGGAGLGRA